MSKLISVSADYGTGHGDLPAPLELPPLRKYSMCKASVQRARSLDLSHVGVFSIPALQIVFDDFAQGSGTSNLLHDKS